MSERVDEIGFGGLRLIQNTDFFCYGIDAVLLADFAARNRCRRIIDLGTNNGVIPMILSRLCETELIAGAEKQTEPFELAKRNVELNGLAEKIELVNCDILDIADHYGKGSFDAVVSNPPYVAGGAGIINEADALAAARHETTAGLEDFVRCADYLLSERGAFYMIHRPERIVDISCCCRKYGLEPKYMRFVSPRAGAKPNLLLVECRKGGGRELKLLEPLDVYGDGGYTEEIMRIYRRN